MCHILFEFFFSASRVNRGKCLSRFRTPNLYSILWEKLARRNDVYVNAREKWSIKVNFCSREGVCEQWKPSSFPTARAMNTPNIIFAKNRDEIFLCHSACKLGKAVRAVNAGEEKIAVKKWAPSFFLPVVDVFCLKMNGFRSEVFADFDQNFRNIGKLIIWNRFAVHFDWPIQTVYE